MPPLALNIDSDSSYGSLLQYFRAVFSAVSAAGRFTRTFIVTNIVIYQRPLRTSNLTLPTLNGGHCWLPARAFEAETAKTPETPQNPR